MIRGYLRLKVQYHIIGILSIQYHLSFLFKWDQKSFINKASVAQLIFEGFFFSVSPYFWLGATDRFHSDKQWYWVHTERHINSGYTDWYHTEPDNLGTYNCFYVFLTSPYNPDAYIFISPIFILLRSIIRVVI